VKSLAVTPLVWIVEPIFTETPVVVKFATKAVTLVPNGTVTAIAVPVMVPVDAGLVKENAVISFVGLNGSPVDELVQAEKVRMRIAARKTGKAVLEIRAVIQNPFLY